MRLTGSRCPQCGEVSLGERVLCPNCGGDAVETVALGEDGVLWSYTVIRHRPPGNYEGQEPFAPFGLGLVELPDGLRVLSPLACDISALQIGMRLRFKAHLRLSAEGERILFTFEEA